MALISDKTEIPDTVYHYCPESSFQGILHSKRLWLSDVHCMNDTTEQTWFINKAKERLQELNQGDSWRDIEPININLEWMALDPHIFCFSSRINLPNQWRDYADDYKGYSIGFSSSWLENQKNRYPQRQVLLWPAEYRVERQIELLNHYIEEYRTSLEQGKNRREAGMNLVTAIYALSGACKNPDFCEEQEIRLMVMEPRHPESFHDEYQQGISERFYRKSEKYDKISYFTLDFPENAITSIYLGPKNNAKNDDSRLKKFLTENGYDINQMEIHNSDVPYC